MDRREQEGTGGDRRAQEGTGGNRRAQEGVSLLRSFFGYGCGYGYG